MPINVSFVLLLCLFFASRVHQFSPIRWPALVVLQGIRSLDDIRLSFLIGHKRKGEMEAPSCDDGTSSRESLPNFNEWTERKTVEKLSVRNDRQSHTKHRPRGHRGEKTQQRTQQVPLNRPPGTHIVQWLSGP